MNPAPFPASPSLEDLGDPKWIAAYEAAGGHVRRARSATGAQQAALVGPLIQPLSKPSPTFLRVIEDARAKVAPATRPRIQHDIARAQDLVRSVSPSRPVVARPEAPPPDDRPEDVVFADLRRSSTAWLDMFCPKVNQCMRAAHDAIARGDAESLAQAGLSMRRALVALADYVEQPGTGTRLDHTGEERKVGQQQFKNRLYIYLGKNLRSDHQRALTLAELELVEHRLNAFVKALGKAVHADSAMTEIAQTYLTAWSVIAQVVHCSEPHPTSGG